MTWRSNKLDFSHVQTLSSRTKPGPSFQLQIWTCVCTTCTSYITTKLPNFKSKTQAKPLLGSLPISFRTPRLSLKYIFLLITLIRLLQASNRSAMNFKYNNPWTNFSRQDKTWAEFSTLDMVVCVPCTCCTVKQYDQT